MPSHLRLSIATALVASLVPQLAIGEVTTDDVLQNQLDYIAGLGGEFTYTTSRQGDTLAVSDSTLAYQLPFGVGSLQFSFTGFDMTRNGDGTVAVSYVSPVVYGIEVNITGKGSFSGNIEFSFTDYVTTASGVPGDITYDWSAARMDFLIKDVKVRPADPSENQPAEVTFSGRGSTQDMAGTLRLKIAEVVTSDSSYTIGKQEFAITGEVAGSQFSYEADSNNSSGDGRTTLPRNGVDVMNLAAAIRDGLAISVSSKVTGLHTSTLTRVGGEVVKSQSTGAQEQSTELALGQSGLVVSGTAINWAFDLLVQPKVPFPITMKVKNLGVAMTLPLAASPELQDVSYGFAFEGTTLGDDMWALFDREQVLPRDPATLKLDISGKVKNNVDWLNFVAVKEMIDAGEVPVELHELTLNDLAVDMVGAKLTGTGAGAFDNSDLQSSGGFPRPSGVIDLALKGGNGLLDKLVAMGLISDEKATGVRLGVAVISNPDPDGGNDALKSRLEMTVDGQILANGQRLR